ncbi:uncharacterized protein BX664DRAFT_362268 [Halteromyces radiatus]|uniref:uncharacterized protein n=1 Tax=Halteromyces radiatus TaxID=101107 RepID=UPI00222020B5|nr:uncharacterized protein BX664DRAFT_362268 [Halteromyces radiatus]KAI8078692.1 hypothetical protein BX664DRAFT_362268 [Halteromyces radiatus]
MPSLQIIDQENDDINLNQTTHQPLCYICQKQSSNYICPRCNLRYCSLSCYKHQQHASCTESFYKDSVMAEIKSLDACDLNKKTMKKILNKFEAENDQLILDEQPLDDQLDTNMKTMEQRFGSMNISQTDASEIWDLLSPQEQHDFQALLQLDAWNTLNLPEYEPWWTTRASKITYIEEDDQEDDNDTTLPPELPALPTAIPALTDIMKSSPAPHLIYHLVHVLMTYAYLARQSMGDLADDLAYGVETVFCLSHSVLFSTETDQLLKLDDVCTDLRRQIHSLEKSVTSSLEIMLLKDTECLLTFGDDFSIRALGELYQLLDVASKEKQLFVSGNIKTALGTKISRKKVGLAARKAYFFMAYANHLKKEKDDTLSLVMTMIRAKYQQLELDQSIFDKEHKVAKDILSKQKQLKTSDVGGKAIVELS